MRSGKLAQLLQNTCRHTLPGHVTLPEDAHLGAHRDAGEEAGARQKRRLPRNSEKISALVHTTYKYTIWSTLQKCAESAPSAPPPPAPPSAAPAYFCNVDRRSSSTSSGSDFEAR
jgi:hypothetical protein